LRELPAFTDVSTDISANGLAVFVDIDREQAARFGITPATVDNALYDSFGQRIVSTVFTNSNQYRVILEADPALQNSLQSLSAIYLPSSVGSTPVPLPVLAKIHEDIAPLQVSHLGQFPSATISFNLALGASLGEAVTAVKQAQIDIDQPLGIITSFQGAALAFQSSLSNQLFLILAAIVTVYIVLGVLYESLAHPITIISTLPSAGLGALIALRMAGMELSVIAFIGIILLIGIVKKNGIMLVDFALEAERSQRLSPERAILEAARERFRPILMTTFAALLGAIPLALATGPGSELRRPLGIAIIGGLVVSQVLTLYTTPIIYLLLDKLHRRLWGKGEVSEPALPERPAAA
jgi:multidrug efflux pump